MITPQMVDEHGLSTEEYQVVLDTLGREPTMPELGVFSVMWSEHCSYKSSRIHLAKLPTTGPRVLIGPGGLFGVAALTVGAVGYVEGIQNYWGKDGNDIYYATMEGDMERALNLQKDGLLLRQLIDGSGRNIYAAFKAAMNIRGLPGGYPRPPLQPLGEPHLSELRQGFREFGLGVAEHAAAE